jgi:hypothetical protein
MKFKRGVFCLGMLVAMAGFAGAAGSGRVKFHNGVPTLYVDGAPHNGLCFASYDQVPAEYREFADAGVNLFSFVISPTGCAYHNNQRKPEKFDLWIAPGQFDFANFDERVHRVLSANPEAKIFPRLSLCAPLWWLRDNPDELGRGTDKDGKEIVLSDGGRQAPSWASDKWRKDTLEALHRLLEHVEASDYAENIIGWHLVSGTTEEWMVWGSNDDKYGDTSKPSLLKFRAWLKEKYVTDGTLQDAWNKPDATLETADFPSREKRSTSTLGSLRDPSKEQDVIDFYFYLSDLVVETIDLFCGEIRKETLGEKLIGVFYGYILQFDGERRLQNSGHLALSKLLQSPNIDFISAPSSYKFRQFGGLGTPHYMAPHGSVKLHGKLWFNENDLRNSITPRMKQFTEEKCRRWGSAADMDGDIVQQEKELAHSMTTGAAQWWFDVSFLNHSDPKLLKRYKEFVKQADEVLAKNRAPVDEMAFVVDDKSSVYMALDDPLGADLVTRTFPALHRIGAPVGHYLLSDLPSLRRHKLLILSNCFAPSDAERIALDKLKSDGRVVLFNYGAGLYDNGQPDLKAMEAFTGIKTKMVMEPLELTVTLGDGKDVQKELRGRRYGVPVEREVMPLFIPDDPLAEVIGRLPDGQPGLVMKRFKNWTAVYSVVPVNNRDLLRWLADEAGVHFYIDTPDLVWANEEMVSVCVDQPGKRKIRLPRACAVKDLYQNKPVSSGSKTFSADFDDKTTRVFLLTPNTN